MLQCHNRRNATWAQLLTAATQWDLACESILDRLGKMPNREDLLSYRLRKDPLPKGIAKGMVSLSPMMMNKPV